MIDLENIKERVRKLMEMASHENSNVNEAETAAKLAKQLLEQYNLEMNLFKEENTIIGFTLPYKGKSSSNSENKIANLLKDYAGVEAYQSYKGFFIVGTKVGISFFTASYHTVLEHFEFGWKRYYSTLSSALSRSEKIYHRRSYEQGFVVGVKEIMDRECTSIKLYKPETEIEDFMKQFNVQVSVSRTRRPFYSEAFSRGMRDGIASRTSAANSLPLR